MKKSLIALAVLAAACAMPSLAAGPPDFQPAQVAVQQTTASKTALEAPALAAVDVGQAVSVVSSAAATNRTPATASVTVHAMAGCVQSPSMAYLPAVPPDPCRRA